MQIYLCNKAFLFAEQDKIVLGNVAVIGITPFHGPHDDTEESLPRILDLRVPDIAMKTNKIWVVKNSTCFWTKIECLSCKLNDS